MRRSSSSSSQSSLQFIAIAAASDTAAMSSRSQYRGGGGGGGGGGRNQWHRGLCNYTTAGRGELVTGDSHCSSVRDANLDFRQGGRGGFHPPTHNPRPYFNQDQHFNNRPHFNHHQPFNPPHFNGNQPFNPRPPFQQNHSIRQPYPYRPRPPKPWYYREWEYARPGPPQHCEHFIVLSYNLLADYLALNHRGKLYYHIPRHMLDWEWRKRNILFELALWSADIMCFQEIDRFRELEEELKLRGYNGFWKMRTGDPVDGCAIFWRASRFKLLHEECIEFNKMGLRDNVAQICVLESVRQYNIKTLPTSSTGSNKVVVCNIHVLYNPRRGEIKLGQIRVLLDKAHAVSKIWNDAPVVICGDFNCTPKSPLYNFISTQKLDLSELARDKLSGQASCEIHSPKPFSINAGAPSAYNPINPSTMINGTEVGAKQSDSRSDMQMQNFPVTSVGNVSFVNELSERLCSSTVLDVSKKSCTDGHYVTECNEKSDQVRKESQQSSDNGYKNETETTTFVPFDQLNESYCNSNRDESSPVDEIIDKDNEFTPSVASDHKGIRADTMETEHKEVNPSAYTDSDLSGEHSQSVLSQNSGSMNCDKVALPLVDGSPTTSGVYLEPVNALNSDVSSFTPFGGHSVPDPVELSCISCLQNPSSPLIPSDEKDNPSQQHHVNVLDASTSIDILQDGKRTNLSLNEPDVDIKVETNVGEDYNTFLSELHDSSAFPTDSGQSERSDLVDRDYTKRYSSPSDEVLDDFSTSMNSEPFDVYKSTYDPSSWTPMEIETATGNADCTCLEHPLKLRSTYTEVEDLSQTRDSNREPQVTSYHRLFLGTVDYIWRTEGLQTVRVLAPIPKHAMQWTPGFPTKRWGSDHISLVSELAFVKDVNDDVQSG